jgi:hypothetical protein
LETLKGGEGSDSDFSKLERGDGIRGFNPKSSIAVLTDDDIKSLGDQFKKSGSPIDRRLAFSKLLQGLTAENALLIREQIEHLEDDKPEYKEFHYAWGAVGGSEAVLFGASTKGDDMSPALAGWASSDPDAAIDWLNRLDMENDDAFDNLLNDRKISVDNLRSHLMRGLVQGLADGDTSRASQFVLEQSAEGNGQARGLIHVVASSVLRGTSPAEGAQWAAQLPEGDVRNSVIGRMAYHYADADPAAAADWALGYAEQPNGTRMISTVSSRWAAQDPAAAVAWASELPEGPSQNEGMRGAMREWAGRDAVAASEYLDTLPNSPSRDSAVSGFSRRLAASDPAAAITWAETISSPEARQETLIGAGQSWTRRDPAAAAEWAARSGLPQDVQQTILNPPREENRWRR